MVPSMRRRNAGKATNGSPSWDESKKNGAPPAPDAKHHGLCGDLRFKPNRKRFAYVLLLVLVLYQWTLAPLIELFVGTGNYDTNGGWLGRVVDSSLQRRFQARQDKLRAQHFTSLGLQPPLLLLRSNRKEVPGYSRYLEEILSRRTEASELPVSLQQHSDEKDGECAWPQAAVEDRSTPSRRRRVVDQLQTTGCRPGWFCHRCLNSPFHGSLPACSFVCPRCYHDVICGGVKTTRSGSPTLSLKRDAECKQGGACTTSTTRIPKVVHQVFVEPLTTLRYPELVRLSNSWRSSGYRYRFYTPDTARSFVQTSYPARFLRAFDSMPSVETQMDLFRLLVLFKEGGIYANIDLLLESNLDVLVERNVSFFAARDDSGLDHCLWNGFLGASAGHPYIAAAIDRLMEVIEHGLTGFDLEQTVCQAAGPEEAALWKIRSSPSDHYSGSCALGMAVHESLDTTNPLTGFELGTRPSPLALEATTSDGVTASSDDLILLMSREDTGAFRCSDVEHNVLIASTGMVGLAKKPVH